ncbi:hypothetical protein [Variovorax boronicumulans]
MKLTSLGLLLVALALFFTFRAPSSAFEGTWLTVLFGMSGAFLLCGGGELLRNLAMRLRKRRLRARATGQVDSIELGRGLFNGRVLVSLVVSFAGEDGLVRRVKTSVPVPLTNLSRYEKGRSLTVLYDAGHLDRGVFVEPI